MPVSRRFALTALAFASLLACVPLKDDVPADAAATGADGDWAVLTPEIESVQVADVTGDGRADLIGLTGARVFVWPSDGTRFVPNDTAWLDHALKAAHGVFFADVNGDRFADAIRVEDDAIYVHASTGSAFGAAQPWTSEPFHGDAKAPGSSSTSFFDVTGDGKADAVGIYLAGIYVMPSDGTSFVRKKNWTGKTWLADHFTAVANTGGPQACFLLGSNVDHVYALPRVGEAFDWGGKDETNYFEHGWTKAPFFGQILTEFADADGDGKADALAVDPTGIRVWRSDGLEFVEDSSEWWVREAVYGTVSTMFRDVTGDGRVDVVAVDRDGVRVLTSTGVAFVASKT